MIKSICIYQSILYYCNSHVTSLIDYLHCKYGEDIKFDQGQVLNYNGICRVIGNKAIENSLNKIHNILKKPIIFNKYSDNQVNTKIIDIKYLPIQDTLYEDIEIKVERL